MNSPIWNARHKPIVVGLQLSDKEQSLIATAASLAQKLQSPLELVHATQPIFSYMGAGDVVVNPYYGYDRVVTDIEEEEARKAMEKVKASIPSGITVNTHVLRDYNSEAVTTIANETHAGLILCGIQRDSKDSLFAGMTTAFSLASHAEVPVMIVPLDSKLDFTTRPRLLVADNLEIEGRHALEAGIHLGIELDCSELCHVHVNQLAHRDVEHLVKKVKEAMNLGRIPENPAFSTEAYENQIRSKIVDDLKYRFHNSQGAAQLKPKYDALVNFGSPVDELHRTATDRKSQIMIFGRHHLFHRRGLALGKVPYSAMVEEGLATLIVPDTEPAQLTEARSTP